MKQYLDTIEYILKNGVEKVNRTGVKTVATEDFQIVNYQSHPKLKFEVAV